MKECGIPVWTHRKNPGATSTMLGSGSKICALPVLACGEGRHEWGGESSKLGKVKQTRKGPRRKKKQEVWESGV